MGHAVRQSPQLNDPFAEAVRGGLSDSLGFNGLSLGNMEAPSPNNSVQQSLRRAAARRPSPWGAAAQPSRRGLALPPSHIASLPPQHIGGGAATPPQRQAPQTPRRHQADSRGSGSIDLSVGRLLDMWAADPATTAAIAAAEALAAAPRVAAAASAAAAAVASNWGLCGGEDSSSGEDIWEVEEGHDGLPPADTELVPPLQHVGPLRRLPAQPPMPPRQPVSSSEQQQPPHLQHHPEHVWARSRQPSGNGFPAAGTHLQEPPRSAGSQGRSGPASIANMLAPVTDPLRRWAAGQVRTLAGLRENGPYVRPK